MARPYTIAIVSGEGTEGIETGSYEVSATINGYDADTIEPKSLTITGDTAEYSLTVSASGILTLHVTEEGTEDGTPVVGASFKRCDSAGNTYGEEVVSNDSGDAVFENVPYADADGPVVYYKQISSDGSHDFELNLLNETLIEEATTIQIFNPPVTSKTLKLTDANYSGLPIDAGEITLT